MPDNSSSPDNSNAVHVFISYAHPDYDIAKALFDILKACGEDRVTCFLDQYTTTTGDNWRESIEKNIEAADLLIFVYRPGHTYDYCGIEMGMLISHNKVREKEGRLPGSIFSIHDVPNSAMPSSLQHRQNRQIIYLKSDNDLTLSRAPTKAEIAFYSKQPFARFLNEFLRSPKSRPLFGMTPGREIEDGERLTEKVATLTRKLTLTFQQARLTQKRPERVFQYRLSIKTGPEQFWDKAQLPATAELTGPEDTFRTISYGGDADESENVTTTWSALRDHYKNIGFSDIWMNKIENDIVAACRTGEWPKSDGVCFKHDQSIYRPVLARQETLEDGSKTFYVQFIQGRERTFVGDSKTTILLAALVSASRFYFYFYEDTRPISARDFSDDLDDVAFLAACKQLTFDIELMMYEASELGLSNPDDLIEAVGHEKKALINAYYDMFYRAKDQLFQTISKRMAAPPAATREEVKSKVDEFAAKLRGPNAECLRLFDLRYRQEMSKVLGPVAQSQSRLRELAQVEDANKIVVKATDA